MSDFIPSPPTPIAPFFEESTIPVHGTTMMNVLYTNMASSVAEWISKVEAILDLSKQKIVGLDIKYTKLHDLYLSPKKAIVIQLCVGTDVLVYHICHADEDCIPLYNFLWGCRYVFAGFDILKDRRMLSHSNLYCHNLKDIQQIWRDPDNTKKRT
jgi:hypothetical protein